MRTAVLVLAMLLVSLAVLGVALLAGPTWLAWPAAALALLTVAVAFVAGLWRSNAALGWFAPLSLLAIAAVAAALASPGATAWVVWPLVLAAIVAAVASALAVEKPARTA